jgi:microcompartment protein CcmL/EutN
MKIGIGETALRIAMAAGLAACATGLAVAHHSFAAFNTETQKVITGTVKKVNWTNPHTWIWIDVANEKGETETWGVEGMSPNYLARRGWTRETIKPGDKLSITVYPMKDGQAGGMFLSAKRPDGEVLSMRGGGAPEP